MGSRPLTSPSRPVVSSVSTADAGAASGAASGADSAVSGAVGAERGAVPRGSSAAIMSKKACGSGCHGCHGVRTPGVRLTRRRRLRGQGWERGPRHRRGRAGSPRRGRQTPRPSTCGRPAGAPPRRRGGRIGSTTPPHPRLEPRDRREVLDRLALAGAGRRLRKEDKFHPAVDGVERHVNLNQVAGHLEHPRHRQLLHRAPISSEGTLKLRLTHNRGDLLGLGGRHRTRHDSLSFSWSARGAGTFSAASTRGSGTTPSDVMSTPCT